MDLLRGSAKIDHSRKTTVRQENIRQTKVAVTHGFLFVRLILLQAMQQCFVIPESIWAECIRFGIIYVHKVMNDFFFSQFQTPLQRPFTRTIRNIYRPQLVQCLCQYLHLSLWLHHKKWITCHLTRTFVH